MDWKGIKIEFLICLRITSDSDLIISEKRIPLLSKEDFKRFVLKHGADKILFGTDCPWAIDAPYIEFIKESGIHKKDIDKILGENAYHLLEIEDCN